MNQCDLTEELLKTLQIGDIIVHRLSGNGYVVITPWQAAGNRPPVAVRSVNVVNAREWLLRFRSTDLVTGATRHVQEKNDALISVIADMERVFRGYAEIHAAKGTEEGDVKARANTQYADTLAAAIRSALEG